MTLNVAGQSSLDRQLVEHHYWRFTPVGIAVPGFFDAIDWTDDEREQFWQAHRVCFAGMGLKEQEPILYSYEFEHRHVPIRTLNGAYEALQRISATGYDTAPGLAIKAAREEAVAQIHREELERQLTWMSGTYEFAREAELASKRLPSGPQANLELMRKVLGMPGKVHS